MSEFKQYRRNPDDGMSAIAYDKGYLFLRMLEEGFGRERFDAFLKDYFQTNSFKVMTTEGFLAYLDEHLLAQDRTIAETCLINDWVYGPGLPENCPVIESNKLKALDANLEGLFVKETLGFADVDTTGWAPQEYLYFAANLPKNIDFKTAASIDRYFHFTTSTNSEILGQWFKVVARIQYQPGLEAMESFLIKVGRRKFLEPIYKELVSNESGLALAEGIYTKAQKNYHAVSKETIEEILAEAANSMKKS